VSEARITVARMTDTLLNDLTTGSVVRPGDREWDAARRFHSGIGEPAVIVRASTVDDVRAAIRYAVAEHLEICVRGGGHSAWGTLPGGLTLDISALDRISVAGTRVSIGGGARWGDVAGTLAAHGLAISSGDTASVGVGGLTLGGGIGWMVRAWGLAADQLVGAQVVTARGDVVEASASSHPDLLWALRGGGGNFGVVTRFDFEAHPLDGVIAADLGIEGDARPVLRVLRDVLRDAPRELTVTYMDVPPMDPSAPAGAGITAVWIGADEAAARAALAPVLALPEVQERSFGVTAYPDVLLEAPAYDPDNPMPGFVGATRCCPSSATTPSTCWSASARRTRCRWSSCARSAAPTAMCRRTTRRSPPAGRRGSRWRGRSTSPACSTRPAARSRCRRGTRSSRSASACTATSRWTRMRRGCGACTRPRCWHGWRPSSARGIRATCSAATTTSAPPERDDEEDPSSAPQCVSSASTSVRSPDHSVWNVPGLSMRL